MVRRALVLRAGGHARKRLGTRGDHRPGGRRRRGAKWKFRKECGECSARNLGRGAAHFDRLDVRARCGDSPFRRKQRNGFGVRVKVPWMARNLEGVADPRQALATYSGCEISAAVGSSFQVANAVG